MADGERSGGGVLGVAAAAAAAAACVRACVHVCMRTCISHLTLMKGEEE